MSSCRSASGASMLMALPRASPPHQEKNGCTAAEVLMLADLPIGEPVPFCLGSLGEGLDLQAALIPNPVCTFYMRVSGNGMRQHGINDGDLMVIDRSVEPCSGHVVVVAHQGSFLLRPLLRQGEQWLLEPVRPGEAAIHLDLEVFDRSGLFGVVVHAVHHLE